jgi:hypothetical protein
MIFHNGVFSDQKFVFKQKWYCKEICSYQVRKEGAQYHYTISE